MIVHYNSEWSQNSKITPKDVRSHQKVFIKLLGSKIFDISPDEQNILLKRFMTPAGFKHPKLDKSSRHWKIIENSLPTEEGKPWLVIGGHTNNIQYAVFYSTPIGQSRNAVYFGINTFGISFAIKQLPFDANLDEISAMIELAQFDNFVRYIDKVTTKENIYLVMDLCECTLKEFLQANNNVDRQQLAQGIFNGIKSMHSAHVKVCPRSTKTISSQAS